MEQVSGSYCAHLFVGILIADARRWMPSDAAKLLLISTGNINNRELEALKLPLIPQIALEFEESSLLELGRAGLVIRG